MVFLNLYKKALKKQGSFPFNLEILGKLLTGDLSLNNLSGPISIAKGAGASANINWCIF